MTLSGEMALILRYFTGFGNDLISHYFTEFVYDVVVKQLLVSRRFQNLLLIVYDYINTICAIIRNYELSLMGVGSTCTMECCISEKVQDRLYVSINH